MLNYVCVCMCTYEFRRPLSPEETPDPLELGFQAESHPVQVMGTKLGSSTKAVSTFNYYAFFPDHLLFKDFFFCFCLCVHVYVCVGIDANTHGSQSEDSVRSATAGITGSCELLTQVLVIKLNSLSHLSSPLCWLFYKLEIFPS